MKKIHVKIAGAVKHHSMFKLIKSDLKKWLKFSDISVYDGPNLCPWNGGRINRNISINSDMVKWYNDMGIGVFFTFSNPVIDISNEIGNDLLNMISKSPLNGVICINEDLRKYVRLNFPSLKIIFSITGHKNNIVINENLLNIYKNLETKYDVIVPRFEMGLDPLFFNSVNTSKYELITNDTCIHGCNIFEEHLNEMSRINREFKEPWKELDHSFCYNAEECWIKGFEPSVGSEKDVAKYGNTLGMDFTQEMYQQAYDLGYRNFKIMGREVETLVLMEDIKSQFSKIKLIKQDC
jgi:hypothetical protein